MKTLALAGLLLLSSGCLDSKAFKTGEKAPQDAAAPPAAAPAAAGAAGPAEIPDVPAKIVDRQKALAENPDLVEVSNRITANDPLTAYAQGYFAAASRAEVLAFTHNIEIHKAANDKYPTFDEFWGYFQSAHVQLRGLKPWQVYAYDETDGSIVILEDKAEKRRRKEAAGLEYTD